MSTSLEFPVFLLILSPHTATSHSLSKLVTCHLSKTVPLGPFPQLCFSFSFPPFPQSPSSCYPSFVSQKKAIRQDKTLPRKPGQKTSEQAKEFPLNVPIVQTEAHRGTESYPKLQSKSEAESRQGFRAPNLNLYSRPFNPSAPRQASVHPSKPTSDTLSSQQPSLNLSFFFFWISLPSCPTHCHSSYLPVL